MAELTHDDIFAVYRGLYPEDAHQAYVFLRAFQNASVPDHPSHIPLANDSTLPDSQKVRYELSYLVEIHKSWEKEYPALQEQLSLQNLLSMTKGKVEKMHMEYTHDGLKYESFPRIGAKACSGGKTHYYLHIPLSNNGYMYRIIDDEDIGFRNISLHRGATHPAGNGAYVSLTEVGAAQFAPFAVFASSWFGCSPEALVQSVFYNGLHNRVDVVLEREDYPNLGDKVSLDFCFEPGFPVKEFNHASFRVTQKYIDGGK
jgi:hypothetical protein